MAAILKTVQAHELSDNCACFLLPVCLPLSRGRRSEGEPGPLRLSSEKSFICLEPELGKSRGWHCLLSLGDHSKLSPAYGRSTKTPEAADLLRFPGGSLKVQRDFQICVTLEKRLYLHSSIRRMELTAQGMCSSRDTQPTRCCPGLQLQHLL